jgi:hypothetical protein
MKFEKSVKSTLKRKELCLEEPASKKPKIQENPISDFPLKKIISGGQNGADRGALEAAKSLGIATGGFAPKDFMTLDGKCPELGVLFGLEEMKKIQPQSAMYIQRSKKNVDESDGTIAFRIHEGIGTDKTIGYCISKIWKKSDYQLKTSYKPILVIDDLSNEKNLVNIQNFIKEHQIKTLNVCGNRESKDPNEISISRIVKKTLMDALKECFIS